MDGDGTDGTRDKKPVGFVNVTMLKQHAWMVYVQKTGKTGITGIWDLRGLVQGMVSPISRMLNWNYWMTKIHHPEKTQVRPYRDSGGPPISCALA